VVNSRVAFGASAALLVLTSIAGGAGARPLATRSRLAKKLARCKQLRPLIKAKPAPRVRRIAAPPGPRIYLFAAKRKRYVVAVNTSHPVEGTPLPCLALPAAPSARVRGRFWPGRGKGEAQALLGPSYAGLSACPTMLLVRDQGGKLRFAIAQPPGCSITIKLAAVSLFNGLETLKLTCQAGGGSDPETFESLYHHLGGRLRRVVGPINRGAAFNDRDHNVTAACSPPGYVRIKRRGAAPLLDVARVVQQSGDTRIVGLVGTMRFDRRKRRFVNAGKPRRRRLQIPCRPVKRKTKPKRH